MNTYTFKAVFNQHNSNAKVISRLQAQIKYMLLEPKTKVTFGIVSITTECDTPHELKILQRMYTDLQKQAV